jgi:YkoY family integral membrane protein
MWGIGAGEFGTILFAILSLVILEGLLSADNALVLAVMVRHLPKRQQKRALRYGIWGAFIFRLIAVIFASILLRFWWLKVAGGLYLLLLAVRHFAAGDSHEEGETRSRIGRGFWATVINVEIADIAFSIDSILAAVAMAEKLPPDVERLQVPFPLLGGVPMPLIIIYLGGVLGIIAMRLVAGVFLALLDRYKGLAVGAYVLVGWIGIGLVESGLFHALHPKPPAPPGTWRDAVPGWMLAIPEMPEWLFWTGMLVIIIGSLLYRPRSAPEQPYAELAEAEGDEVAEPASSSAMPTAAQDEDRRD